MGGALAGKLGVTVRGESAVEEVEVVVGLAAGLAVVEVVDVAGFAAVVEVEAVVEVAARGVLLAKAEDMEDEEKVR